MIENITTSSVTTITYVTGINPQNITQVCGTDLFSSFSCIYNNFNMFPSWFQPLVIITIFGIGIMNMVRRAGTSLIFMTIFIIMINLIFQIFPLWLIIGLIMLDTVYLFISNIFEFRFDEYEDRHIERRWTTVNSYDKREQTAFESEILALDQYFKHYR